MAGATETLETGEPKQTKETKTATLRLKKLISRLVLVVFGLAMSWLFLEIVMRVGFDLLPANFQAQIQHVQRVPWSDERIIPRIPWVIDRDFQLRLPPGMKDFLVHWSDAKFTFNTVSAWDGHRAGFRSDPPRWPLDAVVFGDSFSFCWTKLEDCWVHRLQTDDDWHIFNAAIPGTGTTAQFNLMKEIVPPYKPKIVLWTWYNNDISDDYDLARIRGEVGELQGAPLPDAPPEPEGLARYSAVYNLIAMWLTPAPPKKSTYQHYWSLNVNGRVMSIHTNEYPYTSDLAWAANKFGWSHNVQSHDEAAAFVAGLNAKLILVVIPTKEEAYSAYLQDTLGQAYIDQISVTRRALLDQCTKQGWYCIDLLPAFQDAIKNGQTIYYAFDSHLNVSGNKLLAELVRSYVEKNKLLPGR